MGVVTITGHNSRRNRVRVAVALAAATVIAAAAIIGFQANRDSATPVGTSASAPPPSAAAPAAAPELTAMADADDPFLPTGTFHYTIRTLGSEETGPDGEVQKAAALETSMYRLDVVNDREWTETTLSGPQKGSVQTFKGGVLTLTGPDGEIVATDDFGVDLVAGGPDELLHGRITAVDNENKAGGFAPDRERDVPGGKSRRYVATVTEPEASHYESLPWKDGGNERVHEVSYLPSSGRIFHSVGQLNGFTTYEFTLTEG